MGRASCHDDSTVSQLTTALITDVTETVQDYYDHYKLVVAWDVLLTADWAAVKLDISHPWLLVPLAHLWWYSITSGYGVGKSNDQSLPHLLLTVWESATLRCPTTIVSIYAMHSEATVPMPHRHLMSWAHADWKSVSSNKTCKTPNSPSPVPSLRHSGKEMLRSTSPQLNLMTTSYKYAKLPNSSKPQPD